MNKITEFENEVQSNIQRLGQNRKLKKLSLAWLKEAGCFKYSYNFSFLGRPIIQIPQDMVAIQELIWQVKPDLIIETGIAHGGSLVMSAAMLTLLDVCEPKNARKNSRMVLGIDIEIRAHNRAALIAHPLSYRIKMLEGSSIAPGIIAQVNKIAKKYQKIMVLLDSMHTHEHVLAELEAYGPLISKESYCVVFDTLIEDLDQKYFKDRPWGPGNNPKTAVEVFLKKHKNFEVDKNIEAKLQLTVSPGGYLKRKK